MTQANLNCDGFQQLLPEYLEEGLGDSALADAELHLASCAECRELVADLREIARQAASLPVLVPSRELWPEIEARTQPRVLPLVSRPVVPASWSRWRLGAIAAGLMAITALTTWQLTRRTGQTAATVATTPQPVAPAVVESVAPVPTTAPSAGTLRPVAAAPARAVRPEANVTFAQEIARLRGVLDERQGELDPRTVAILQSSLATIDSAIADARRALASDPASRFLTQQLNRSLERKLGLLRQAALLSPSI
jgi:hypothetical protein